MVPPSADIRLVRAHPITKKMTTETDPTSQRRSLTVRATAADNRAIVQAIDPTTAVAIMMPLFQ